MCTCNCGSVLLQLHYYIYTLLYHVTDSVIVCRALIVLLYLCVTAFMLLYLGVTAFIAKVMLHCNEI